MSEVENVTLFFDMQKLTINTWKIMIKIPNLNYWDANNLHEWAMSQKLSVVVLSGLKTHLHLLNRERSRNIYKIIKDYNEVSDEGYFLEVDVQYPEKIHDLLNDFFNWKNENQKSWKTCSQVTQ